MVLSARRAAHPRGGCAPPPSTSAACSGVAQRPITKRRERAAGGDQGWAEERDQAAACVAHTQAHGPCLALRYLACSASSRLWHVIRLWGDTFSSSGHAGSWETVLRLCPMIAPRGERSFAGAAAAFEDARSPFRHCHGGTGYASAHRPRLADRASASSGARVGSFGAYGRYHQARPVFTSA
jgi:hypothetical protein